MPRKAILNVAVGSWYGEGQSRLARSLHDLKETSQPVFWRNCYPRFSPTHQQIPYAFKPYAFATALMRGYDLALWLDASTVAKKSLVPIWRQIEEDGYLFAREGWLVGEWANDFSLEVMGITREQAMKMSLCMGTPIGLNLSHPTGKEFLRRWLDLADQGAFNGSHSDHRHDITCAGFLIADMGLKLTDNLISLTSETDAHFFYARGL